jgi:hypothetical protein
MIGRTILPMSISTSLDNGWTQEGWQEEYDSYQRPADWLQLSSLIDGDQKIVMLHKIDDHDSNFCAFIVSGDYIVDWGDGSAPVNYSSGVTALYNFDYNASGIASQTPTSLGYKQVIVTISPQIGQNLTILDLNVKHTQVGLLAYSTGWLDISMAGAFFTSIGIGSDSVKLSTLNVTQANLEIFDYIGSVSASFVNTSYMFINCLSLNRIVDLNTINVTNTNSMFNGCSSLTTFPLFNLSSLVTATQMFNNCYSLTTVPLFNLGSLVTATSMFNGCSSLKTVPLFNLGSLVTATQMFNNCKSLTTVPLFNLGSLVTATSMFNFCSSLTTFPLFNLSSLVTATSMFQYCYSLTTVPLFNLSSVTNTTSMFDNCSSLTTVPLFNLSSLVTATLMFLNCSSLTTVPLFNLGSVTNTTSMFNGCSSLTTVPLFNLSSLVTATSMFQSCYSLTTVPLFNLGSLVTATSMFNFCSSLTTVPLFNLNSLVTSTSMFQYCYSLTTVPLFDLNSLVTATQMFLSCSSLSKVSAVNIKTSINFSSCKLSKNNLQSIFSNSLASNVTTQTITITSNYGSDTAISKTLCGVTTGSSTITQTNTSGLLVGMRVSGTGIDTAVSITLQTGANTITRASHGLTDNKIIYLMTLVTTTGATIKRPYYVVNSTSNTFQISLTLGGSPITLVNNGTGTIYYGSYIISIINNVSFTIDVPASSSGTVTLSNRNLDTSLAIGKGWVVT